MAELRTPQGHALLLPEGGISVGADPENEVPVAAHLGLAPVHFRLQPWEGGHFIEDAGSGLGTLVNGHPVNWKPLVHGDIITAGELEVIYTQQAMPVVGKAPIAVAPPVAQAPPVPVFPAATSGSASASAAPAVSSATATTAGPATEIPESPSPPVTPSWEPPAVITPPSWLPADLLPEGYRVALPEKSTATAEHPSPPAPSATPEPAWLPSQPRRKTKRRLLPVAAVLAVLGGAAFLAWQQGILPQWLKKADGLGNPPTAGPAPIAQTTASFPTPAPAPVSKPAPLPSPAKVAPPAVPVPVALPTAPVAPQVVKIPASAIRQENPPPALPPVEIRAAIPVRK